MDGVLKDSASSEFVANFALDFSQDLQQSDSTTSQAGSSTTTTYKNTSDQDLFLQLYSDQYNYSAPYKLFGYLTYDISEKGSEQDSHEAIKMSRKVL